MASVSTELSTTISLNSSALFLTDLALITEKVKLNDLQT